eukprot:CAMPEP_0204363030 /NCGR_PEP_ID=MMETSP0469-20131031/40061_1 /ASSEMBLY_ACC=CAM_ASM_000384 /TAXON_ID=2969 /ORGANISM="Oxyrrhis marina" /LENGTH=49 /DNA_ID= /DNA_START= /DNA_END= /DNA_ORIENTATION=
MAPEARRGGGYLILSTRRHSPGASTSVFTSAFTSAPTSAPTSAFTSAFT